MDELRGRILRLEADVISHDVRIKKVEREFAGHAEHHLELANIVSEFRQSRETARAENAMMIESIKGIVTSNTSRAVDWSNILQVVVLVLVAAIYVVGDRLGIGLAAIGGAEAAVLALAAWFIRRAKVAGRVKREGSGFSFPPYKNGGDR